jgi:transcriptional/translational regulatory protein YebC/TACO1
MGRQWLQAKRVVANLKKGQANGKLLREIMIAAKLGGSDPDCNARLFAAIAKARRESCTRDGIERAIKKGAGTGDEKMSLIKSDRLVENRLIGEEELAKYVAVA